MKTLVTGANGLLGNNLVRRLLRDGHTVRGLVRENSRLDSLAGLDAELVRGDVRDVDAFTRAAEGVDAVFHTAAVFSYWGHSREDMETTARAGGRNVIDAACDAGVGRVVLTSSTSVWGRNPNGSPVREQDPAHLEGTPDYFRTKALQERTALDRAAERGVDLVVANPAVFVGPRDFGPSASFNTIFSYLSDPARLTYAGGVDCVHVDDVASAHVILASEGKSGERYIVSSEHWSWRELHSELGRLTGIGPPRVTVGPRLARVGTALMELGARVTGRAPQGTRDQAALAADRFWYDSTKIGELGWKARPVRETLVDTLAWHLERGPARASLEKLSMSEDVEAARSRYR